MERLVEVSVSVDRVVEVTVPVDRVIEVSVPVDRAALVEISSQSSCCSISSQFSGAEGKL